MAPKTNKPKADPSPKPTRKPRKIEAKAPIEPSNRGRGLTVVGIGASAGGLAALSTFFDALPDDTGMVFVVVTHLHPEHESHMAELLQKHTQMPAMQVTQKVKVEADHVYVIPPARSILMTDTHLDTKEYEALQDRRSPIDHFFRSMAQSGHSDPVAIILSGGGTDGSVGIKDVKEVGGLIMVQQPEDAEYDSMPRAALSTGLVDIVLPAAQLAKKLAEYIQHHPQLPHDAGQLTETELEILQRILAQVHARTGHDFAQYKRSTILRRVERRMQLNGFNTLDAYLAYLRGNATEAQAMFNDILIGVTNFFRDHESWETLQKKVIPELFKYKQERQDGDGIRVWSIGCATGEEAYGLAILLFEEMDRQDAHTHIQVFASDLDDRSIAHAREGLYPAAIEADVSAERLERFFTREGEYYRVKRELRDAVLFTNHNIMRDPPFSRQSLIACRNVLIYLQRTVQDRVFDIFHYSLNLGGYLFLGTSESAEHLLDLFNVIDKNHRIYQSRPWVGERPHVPSMPLTMRQNPRLRQPNIHPPTVRFMDEPVVLEEQHQRALESYGPPSIVVNERNMILHVSETAGRYLHQPKGPITGDLLALVRPELQLELRTALFHAFEKNKATISRPVDIGFNGNRRRVILTVRPQPDEAGVQERQALVIFVEDELTNPDETVENLEAPRTQAERDQMVAQLQMEIQRLREQLQITVEEYDSSNEEMKAANEELQSINEEYRSATEELETSKEELQSVNEELQTVNSEMRNKLDEISRAHRELENLMGATEIVTLYLDRELRIQRYTAGVQEIFNVLNVDRGRRISDLTHKLGYNQFMEDAEQVLRKLIPIEREIQRSDGRWFLMRLRPYRTIEDRIEGVVITFIDITELKKTEQELRNTKDTLEQRVNERTSELDEANRRIGQARDLFYALFHANPIPTSLTRLEDGLFLDANEAYLDYYGFKRTALIGRTSQELYLPIDPNIRPQLVERIRKEGILRSVEVDITHPSGERKTILASLQLTSVENAPALITAFIDITERVKAEQQIRALATELTAAEQAERHQLAQILHDDLQQRIFAIQMQMSFLKDAYDRNDLKAFAADFPQMETWLTEAIQVTRQLSVDLSPPILHGESLIEALLWLGTQMQDQYGMVIDVKSDGHPVKLDERLRVLVFYAVRELLFNVVKHAGTLRANIDFEHHDRLRVIVRDQGKGFDVEEVINNPKISHGLMIIRHRLSLLGCSLDIKSQPGKGTEVIIEVPHDPTDR